jgi:hypothetical protein
MDTKERKTAVQDTCPAPCSVCRTQSWRQAPPVAAKIELENFFAIFPRPGLAHAPRFGLLSSNPSVRTVQRTEDAIDAVAGVTEDVAHSPLLQALDKKIANRLGHGTGSFWKGHGFKRWFRGHVPIGSTGSSPRSSLPR